MGDAPIEQAKAMIGTVAEPTIWEVERGAIRRYAEAIDDPNPLFRDVEHARGKYGDLICPPGFFGWSLRGGGIADIIALVLPLLVKAGYPALLDGGVDYEFMLPVRAGDTLTSWSRLADITEREGRAGKMIFTTVETTYINQNGDVVAKARQTLISR